MTAMLKATVIPADSFEDTSRCMCIHKCVCVCYPVTALTLNINPSIKYSSWRNTPTVQSRPQGCVWRSEQQVGRFRKTEKPATCCEWFLTQTWQISSCYISTHVTLCVCSLFFLLRRGGGQSERVIVQPTERQTDWMKLHLLLLRAFPMFWFAPFFFFLLSKVGFTEPFPAMPSNSPAATEPPHTPENEPSNDVVRNQMCCYHTKYNYHCYCVLLPAV